MAESLRHKTVKGVGWSLLDNISSQGVTFLVGLVLARLLSPEEYGLIGIILVFVAVFNSIVDGGLSYKPETDDMREAPSLVLIKKLLDSGCRVQVYDPVAMPECRRRIGDKVVYGRDMYDAAVDADALLLVTEWKAFRLPSWQTLKRIMRSPVIFDGRNIFEGKELFALGFEYEKIG